MLAYLKATETERSGWSRDLYYLKKLKAFFTGRELGKLKRADVRGYIEQRKAEGIANATINREVGLFSSAINYARREWDWDIHNPAERMRLSEGDGRKRFATVEEVSRLIKTAEQHKRAPYLADLIRVAVNTACRRGELLGLRWSQVDLETNTLKLEGKDTKNGKPKRVPLNQQARAALLNRLRYREKHCPDTPWVFCRKSGERTVSIQSSWEAVLKEAELEDFHFHDLRHTCGSWLVQSGVPLADVKEVLGHSTIRMTERYAHNAPENSRAAVEKLNALSQSGLTSDTVSLQGALSA
ncbi:MAG: site-specific integrase [Burkholderiales bacterium]|nr:site-specific integrase [Burkholderiales bacterium]